MYESWDFSPFIFQGREILQFLELKISKIIFVYK